MFIRIWYNELAMAYVSKENPYGNNNVSRNVFEKF